MSRTQMTCDFVLVVFCGLFWSSGLFGDDTSPIAIQLTDPLPYGQKPIDYFGAPLPNPIEHLKQRLESDEFQLGTNEQHGFLSALLKELDISPTSQVLVFSKTALNPKLVSPETPRAVYFNEETYVGYVPGAASLEIATVDPVKGWLFYTLTQPEFSPTKQNRPRPTLERERQCLACHAGQSSLRVPGGLVRGFVPDEKGNPLSGYSRINHETDFEKRFGGWYLTGQHGRLTHRGNIFDSKTGPARPLMSNPNNRKDLTGVFDTSRYLSAHSDLVAQMLLHHQVHGQNLLIRVGYEARFGKRSDAEEQLVRYLLFADEAPLTGPLSGSTAFAEWFQKRGTVDSQERNLREWNLKTHLFQHRLSYLIRSRLFVNLPQPVKDRLYDRMQKVLSNEKSPLSDHRRNEEERKTLRAIVKDLKKGGP
ncbi:MAG: hypothetical protein KDA84_11225 [Planctomycetaceae bacterium]|nr:hypothetical protein [Planctomycetaceae bacterium]